MSILIIFIFLPTVLMTRGERASRRGQRAGSGFVFIRIASLCQCRCRIKQKIPNPNGIAADKVLRPKAHAISLRPDIGRSANGVSNVPTPMMIKKTAARP